MESKNSDTNESIQTRNGFTDIENKCIVIKGESREEGKIRGMGLTDKNCYI